MAVRDLFTANLCGILFNIRYAPPGHSKQIIYMIDDLEVSREHFTTILKMAAVSVEQDILAELRSASKRET